MQRPLIFVGLALLLGCASGDNSTSPTDAGPDGTFFDAPPAVDQYVPPPAPDAGPDVADEPPPTDDGGNDAGDDSDAAEAGEAGCGALGQLCDSNAMNGCPFFQLDGGSYICMQAFTDGGFDAGEGGTFDGVCVGTFRFPLSCDDGSGSHCASTDKCLQASQMCLTDQETQCICNNPLTMSACGPP
jgi:hypothetical protein